MLIVDAQVHIWSAGPPTNPSHRQVSSYTAEECIRDMDAAGVDACILHPPGWDPRKTPRPNTRTGSPFSAISRSISRRTDH